MKTIEIEIAGNTRKVNIPEDIDLTMDKDYNCTEVYAKDACKGMDCLYCILSSKTYYKYYKDLQNEN